jgi:hypothetical protein
MSTSRKPSETNPTASPGPARMENQFEQGKAINPPVETEHKKVTGKRELTVDTKRSYWVDWKCVFSRVPEEEELEEKKIKMKKYLTTYLDHLISEKKKNNYNTNQSHPEEEVWNWDKDDMVWRKETEINTKAENESGIPVQQQKIRWYSPWVQMLRVEWQYINYNPIIYTFKAYFEGEHKVRITVDSRSSMNPPPPPPPPGLI